MSIPKAISAATFTIFGVPIKCYVLDNGQRIIDAADFAALMDRMADSSGFLNSDDLDGFTEWARGKPTAGDFPP